MCYCHYRTSSFSKPQPGEKESQLLILVLARNPVKVVGTSRGAFFPQPFRFILFPILENELNSKNKVINLNRESVQVTLK